MPGTSATRWTAAYTRQVAENIRHHRRRRGLSVQALADRCTGLGYPLERANLAKLESGHRASMTLPELLVLAHALRTPPLLLLAPLGRADTVEILPGVEAASQEAVFWLDGTAPLLDDHDEGADARAELRLLREHRRLVDDWCARTGAAAAAREHVGEEAGPHEDAWAQAARVHGEHAEHAAERLSYLRAGMRLRGLPLPGLPPGLIHLDHREG
ncbi:MULTISPECIES: hypothetical protein [Nonomuraea]|uniref:HTH cro/C1-type domain-containing protein n=1 Tax=Nonomuraea mangrovi TaxID=2316207 RepID=A0ABW4SXX0_9ACTN